MASISSERRRSKRRRFRFGFALGGATAAAAAAAAVLAIFVLGGGGEEAPSQHVSFASLPAKMQIGARLEPRPFGTEVHVYVSGVRSGELCRVFLESKNGERGGRASAGRAAKVTKVTYGARPAIESSG
jgi:acyl-coenzyme A thioesterase PaaI-like protein